MSKSNHMDQTNHKKRGLLLTRACLPPVFLTLMTVSLYIPCLRFTTADTGTGETISLAALLGNAWEQVREFLFGAEELSAANETFSWTVLILILVCVLLYLVGAVATVWSSVGAIHYASELKERGTARALYLTLFPNRIATCIWQGLVLPLLAFPRLLVLCYDRVLYYPVILHTTFPEPLLIGGALYVLSLILCVLSRKGEIALGISPYRVRERAFTKERAEKNKEESRLFSTAPATDTDSDIERSSREEQAERIRELLNKQENRRP